MAELFEAFNSGWMDKETGVVVFPGSGDRVFFSSEPDRYTVKEAKELGLANWAIPWERLDEEL